METGKRGASPSLLQQETTVIQSAYRHPLHIFFAPESIAVIGATEKEGSVGRTLLSNLLLSPTRRAVFPINPRHSTVLGMKAYPNLAALPQAVDLAVIATPAPTVPKVIAECVATGVKGAIILSAGFKECGTAGEEMEQQILAQARQGQLRVVGPNCLGIMCPPTCLNATFAGAMARPGQIGFISQSGALCTAVLDWSLQENIGFSAFVSIGSMVDVDWGDLIDYLGNDPHTSSIVMYLETVGDARAFLSAARAVARTKPIILLKAGRSQEAAKAAVSHTGALAGSQEVFEAACRRCGILMVDRIDELFSMAEALATQPRPRGPRLTMITNAGGPGVLATDALIASGGTLAQLSPDTIEALNQILPAPWSHGNPIDILGDADPERYARVLDITARDPNSDGLLVILTPQAMAEPTRTAEQVRAYASLQNKPVLASWMGGAEVEGGRDILHQAGIPTFAYPDTAARIFQYMWHSRSHIRNLYETPSPWLEVNQYGPDRDLAAQVITSAYQEKRTLLTEVEAKRLLAAYGIPVVETQVATTEEEAVACAQAAGYPVVLKLFSKTITHKSDVGGVQLNLLDEAAVRRTYHQIITSVREQTGSEAILGVTVQPMVPLDGYELILGSSLDSQFGPVLLFGSGGQLVEVYRDRALALPPLTTTLARHVMEQTRVFQALQGTRGRSPVDLNELEQVLVRLSYLVTEQNRIKEIDINPLLASSHRLLALDARIVLHEPEVPDEELPRLAIRPYPLQYVQSWTLHDGTPVVLRPIRPEDETLMIAFHRTLSDESVYARWLHLIKLSQRIAHERLIGVCFLDYDREIALVAERVDPQTGKKEILGVGRLIKRGEPVFHAVDGFFRHHKHTVLFSQHHLKMREELTKASQPPEVQNSR
ncbi:MAG TPA: acetate--CoA ligase family protein, partial [Ktedonobacteraceae bacterium]|nr:acetate--CoA ligase family protein [Ktedonobacteraceae bacterium]